MMKYIKNNYIVPMICTVLCFSGCNKDVLETAAYGESTSATFWRNGEDAVSAANAMYTPLSEEEFYGHNENVFDNCSDDLYRAGDHEEETAMENFTFNASNGHIQAVWKIKYEMINRANAVLINVPGIEDIDADLKNRILGEAHFLRGFGYWRFSVIFGEVPLILEDNFRASDFNIAKSSVEEVQAQVEADLIAAASMLPETHTSDNIGRPTKGTANGLLAKLYLYQEKFSEAISAGTNVIEGPYPLADNFRDNFTPETENNPEMLFAAQGSNWKDNAQYYVTPREWGGWDFQNPVTNVVEEFESGDPRLENSLFKPGDMVQKGPELVEFTEDLTATGYSQNKFTNFREDGSLSNEANVPILRSADVYLIVAEAKIRKDGAGAGDDEINAVRERVGLPAISNAGMPELIHERRCELLGENQRHQDLMRWDRAGIVDIVAIYGEDRGPFDPVRVFVRPKHYYFPLPQQEIDISNGVLEQNKNY